MGSAGGDVGVADYVRRKSVRNASTAQTIRRNGRATFGSANTESKKARLSRAFQADVSVENQPGLFLLFLSLATIAIVAMITAPAITQAIIGTPTS
jgi:hypothetical protein